MKTKYLMSFLLLCGVLFLSSSDYGNKTLFPDSSSTKFVIRNDLQKYFRNCNVDGTIVILDINKSQWIVSDSIGSQMETLPASTFKIPNLLIALETGAIKDENEIVKWSGEADTATYGYRPEIYHDMSVKEAFEVSAVWVFIDLAKRIGRDNYSQYLKQCKYGNLNLSHEEDDFWNFGALGISPINQILFLKRLYECKLPFSVKNMEVVKNIMITEQQDGYIIRSKTGWTNENGFKIGWWVGYLEKKEAVYFFATRLLQDARIVDPYFGNCRKEITKEAFRTLGIIE